jgi:hypothetical protein
MDDLTPNPSPDLVDPNDRPVTFEHLSGELRRTLEALTALGSVSAYAGQLAEQSGDSEEDLLWKALALYETALEAKDHDHRIVIVTKDYKFVQEITGIGRPVPEPQIEAAVG